MGNSQEASRRPIPPRLDPAAQLGAKARRAAELTIDDLNGEPWAERRIADWYHYHLEAVAYNPDDHLPIHNWLGQHLGEMAPVTQAPRPLDLPALELRALAVDLGVRLYSLARAAKLPRRRIHYKAWLARNRGAPSRHVSQAARAILEDGQMYRDLEPYELEYIDPPSAAAASDDDEATAVRRVRPRLSPGEQPPEPVPLPVPAGPPTLVQDDEVPLGMGYATSETNDGASHREPYQDAAESIDPQQTADIAQAERQAALDQARLHSLLARPHADPTPLPDPAAGRNRRTGPHYYGDIL
jgi:hypothetical protein